MSGFVSRIIEGTITLILAYLIIVHADEFSVVVESTAVAYSKAVRALQGR